MKQTIFILLMCLTFLLSQNGWAQSHSQDEGNVYIEANVAPIFVKKNNSESDAGGSVSASVSTESGLGYDARFTAGYVAWQQVMFGLSYNTYSVNTTRSRTTGSDGLTTSTTRTDFGPTVAWLVGGWRFAFTYIFSAQKKFNEKDTDASTGSINFDNHYTNSGGSGYELSVAYGLSLGSNWTIGPMLIYRDVSYGKQALDSAMGSSYPATSTSAPGTPPIDAQLQPMISITARF